MRNRQAEEHVQAVLALEFGHLKMAFEDRNRF